MRIILVWTASSASNALRRKSPDAATEPYNDHRHRRRRSSPLAARLVGDRRRRAVVGVLRRIPVDADGDKALSSDSGSESRSNWRQIHAAAAEARATASAAVTLPRRNNVAASDATPGLMQTPTERRSPCLTLLRLPHRRRLPRASDVLRRRRSGACAPLRKASLWRAEQNARVVLRVLQPPKF